MKFSELYRLLQHNPELVPFRVDKEEVPDAIIWYTGEHTPPERYTSILYTVMFGRHRSQDSQTLLGQRLKLQLQVYVNKENGKMKFTDFINHSFQAYISIEACVAGLDAPAKVSTTSVKLIRPAYEWCEEMCTKCQPDRFASLRDPKQVLLAIRRELQLGAQ